MGLSLIKKVLGRKDFVMVMASRNPEYDEENINSFIKEVQDEKGRIIKIQGIENISSSYHDGQYVGEGIYTYTENNYLIHYKCHKKVELQHLEGKEPNQ